MGPDIPAVIDVGRVVLGFIASGFAFLGIGLMIGRRFNTSAQLVAKFHARIERQLNAAFTSLEELMVANSTRLMDAIKAADTKLDGYVAIIDHQAAGFKAAFDALQAMRDEPTPEAVDGVLADLGAHINAAGTAVDHLAAADKPVVDTSAPAQPQPQPMTGVVSPDASATTTEAPQGTAS